jgi:hypothetical protein
MTDLVAVFFGVVALLCAAAIYSEFRGRLNRLDERVRKLEDAKQKRINYESLEEIDNAFAALIVVEREIEIKKNALDNLREHLVRARNPRRK